MTKDKFKKIELSDMKLPQDIKKLSFLQLNDVCAQIRKLLIKTVSKNGGHLASNLGTVELTVAIHRAFDAPYDKIVWDVGHQAYTHKILTGRLDRFATLRQKNGISGFPKPSESEYDSFISGHSSNSISAALGMATAMKQSGDKSHYAVAVIGDGAFTGGLAYEGLNNAGKSDTNIIIILNHNGMSISKNVGGLAKYLSTLRIKQSYLKTKSVVENILDKTPVLGKPVKKVIRSSKSALKNAIIHSTMFEDFGFEFVGPVDGHNIEELEEAFNNAKAMKKPVFIHVNTVKGKGYTPAEQNPGEYHGIGKFEISTGNPDIVPADSYSSEWGKELSRLADKDRRIIAVSAAMKYGTGLQYFTMNHKDRFYDVGIAEEHAITFSSGLSSMGYLPVFSVYSTFLQRAYDEILHDCSIANEHIVIGIDRAGIVGEDGETHQGVFDVSFLTSIPNTTLYSPSCYDEMRLCLNNAIYKDTGIVGIRYPKGNQQYKSDNKNVNTIYDYKSNNSETLLITYGRLSTAVSQAAGDKYDFLKLVKIFPIDKKIIKIASEYKNVFFFEESYKNGSVSEKMLCELYKSGFRANYYARCINNFIKQSTVNLAISEAGLDYVSICDIISKELADEKKS